MSGYVLGADQEIARLDAQSAVMVQPTRLLLELAGIGRGMRVLDLGTGLGHVARAVADLVGDQGRVVAIDNQARLLKIAAERTADRPQVSFVAADVRTFRDEEPFDAVVG